MYLHIIGFHTMCLNLNFYYDRHVFFKLNKPLAFCKWTMPPAFSVWEGLVYEQCNVHHVIMYFSDCFHKSSTYICTTWYYQSGLISISRCTWVIGGYCNLKISCWRLLITTFFYLLPRSDTTLCIFSFLIIFTFSVFYRVSQKSLAMNWLVKSRFFRFLENSYS